MNVCWKYFNRSERPVRLKPGFVTLSHAKSASWDSVIECIRTVTREPNI